MFIRITIDILEHKLANLKSGRLCALSDREY